jgi:O-antigen/teichoic acid export membrane protein
VSPRLKEQVIRALPWSFGESIVNGFAGLALTFILAWFLEPKQLGQAAVALAVVGVVEIVAGMGMIEAVVGVRSAHTRISDTAFTAIMVSSLVAAGLCLAVADPVGRLYGDPDVIGLLQLAALIPPLNAFAAIPTALLSRKMRARALTLRMVTSRVVTIVGIGLLAVFGFGAWAPVAGSVAGSFAAVLVLALTMSRLPRLRFSLSEFRGLLAFGAASSIERLLWGMMIRLFWLVIGYVHGTTVLGYFQFAQRLVDEIATLMQTFSIRFGLAFFAAIERAGQDPTNAYLRATRLITVATAPAFMGLALIMPDLIGTIFDSKWAPAVIVAQITALGWVVAFPRVLVGPVLRARGRQTALVTYAAISCLLTLTAGLLTGGQGLLVVALIWVMHRFIGVPWSLHVLNRHLGISPRRQIAASMRPLVATVLMAGAVLVAGALMEDWAPIQRLIALVAAGMASYAVMLMLIDRATLRLGRTLLTDLWRVRRTA